MIHWDPLATEKDKRIGANGGLGGLSICLLVAAEVMISRVVGWSVLVLVHDLQGAYTKILSLCPSPKSCPLPIHLSQTNQRCSEWSH